MSHVAYVVDRDFDPPILFTVEMAELGGPTGAVWRMDQSGRVKVPGKSVIDGAWRNAELDIISEAEATRMIAAREMATAA
jgi:hypothetical protein